MQFQACQGLWSPALAVLDVPAGPFCLHMLHVGEA